MSDSARQEFLGKLRDCLSSLYTDATLLQYNMVGSCAQDVRGGEFVVDTGELQYPGVPLAPLGQEPGVKSSESSLVPIIVGIVVGVLLLSAGGIAACWFRKRNREQVRQVRCDSGFGLFYIVFGRIVYISVIH